MSQASSSARSARPGVPRVLPMRQRAEIVNQVLKKRLETVLPEAMRAAGLDMWLILCQEDNPDPVHATMLPADVWTPILQMLVFFDRGEAEGVERINLSMTDMQGLFDKPWDGRDSREQWARLAEIVTQRDPKRIGVNTGQIQWAAGGLTHNLYEQLLDTLQEEYVARLEPAEAAVVHWAATLSDDEAQLYEQVVAAAKAIITECYSREVITPDVTTLDDLKWAYRQRVADLGLELAFTPYFRRHRSDASVAQFGVDDPILRPGDLLHCDVGIKYLRLTSDHQQWAYLAMSGETDAPEPMRRLMAEANRLQDIFLDEFRLGLTGNELLAAILDRARREGVPSPMVYSHSLGLFLHEPGPLIGLPWEQVRCEGRGDVALGPNQAFTMELSVTQSLPDWSKQDFRMSIEEDVFFDGRRCRVIGDRQTEFRVV